MSDNQYCRFCGSKLEDTFIDLGFSPLANEYLSKDNLNYGQHFYPLIVHVCPQCFLTQAEIYQQPQNIFTHYEYFSSYSSSWLQHCKAYVDMITNRLRLDNSSHVLEIACNDGYLLQYFLPYHIPVKGIDPAENVIIKAEEKGIEVQCGFFNVDAAKEMLSRGEKYDLIIGNNVLAHVPDIKNFVCGLPIILKSNGTITMEFPHLMQLIKHCQFDTIYHEHFSYLSLSTVSRIFGAYGLKIYDVEELPTHGGSLRIYVAHIEDLSHPVLPTVEKLIQKELEFGIQDLKTYHMFQKKAFSIKLKALELFSSIREQGKRIAAFGAAAKGNTFLNYCGIKRDMIDFVVDSNPHKQGLYLPGSLIPIVSQEVLKEKKPDYVLILPWNMSDEIVEVAGYIREWGGQFISCIPELKVF